MDFIEVLPHLGSANFIMVFVNEFRKFVHFMQLPHPFLAYKVAVFLDNIYWLHSMLTHIVID